MQPLKHVDLHVFVGLVGCNITHHSRNVLQWKRWTVWWCWNVSFFLQSSTLGNHGSRSVKKETFCFWSMDNLLNTQSGVTWDILTFYISSFLHSNKLLHLLSNIFSLCILISIFGSFLLVVDICANSLDTLSSCYSSWKTLVTLWITLRTGTLAIFHKWEKRAKVMGMGEKTPIKLLGLHEREKKK